MEGIEWMRLAVFAGGFAMLAALQMLLPKRPMREGLRRWPANLAIVALDALLVRLLLPMGAVGVAMWASARHLGVLHALPLGEAGAALAAIVLLDLVIYWQHRMFHRLPLFWRMHMVHHADKDIDVTTGLRFHPLEILVSMLIKMAAVIAIGAPPVAVFVFEVVLNGMAMFNHANIALPRWLDRWLRLLVVTPDMHRVHHSVRVEETNSNYGFNLSLWDRVFGSYRAQPAEGHAAMTIGLAHLQHAPTARLGYMLRLPFIAPPGQYPARKRTQGDVE